LFLAGELLLDSAPQSARSAYGRIDDIGGELLALERGHKNSGSREGVSPEDESPVIKKLQSEKSDAFRLAQPALIW
jgi:hypothetical protein